VPEAAAVERVLAELSAGVGDAAERLFETYGPIVREAVARFLALRCRGRIDLADDLTHEVFLALLRDGGAKLRTFQGRNGCSFAGWLRVVAVRLAIDTLRRERHLVSLDDESPRMLGLRRALSSDTAGPEERLQGSEALGRLARIVDGLSPKDRLLVELHLVRGAAVEEVAAVLGVTMNAVYVRKHRVLERLRREMREGK
jgi:RNA polymerase sigma-70 factor, ECF subfamily